VATLRHPQNLGKPRTLTDHTEKEMSRMASVSAASRFATALLRRVKILSRPPRTLGRAGLEGIPYANAKQIGAGILVAQIRVRDVFELHQGVPGVLELVAHAEAGKEIQIGAVFV